jgi:hypothetical protein
LARAHCDKNACSAQLLRRLVLSQRTADMWKYRINGWCYVADTGYADESNQSNQQSIFHEILTFIAVLQALEMQVQA